LAVAAAAHGLYDFLLISPLVSPFVVLLLIAALQYALFAAISRAAKLPGDR